MNKNSTSTEYRQELKERILETACQQFRTKGIRAVKMDDIANMLSVSKRTVYEIYDNKEQLLMECVKRQHYATDRQMCEFAAKGDKHVMDIILEFYRIKMRDLTTISPVYFTEMHRYPEIIKWLERKHNESDHNAQEFFRQGIEEGYFRTDVNYELITKVASGTMDYIMKNHLYQVYGPKEMFRNVIMLYIRGFCTAKGIIELERQMSLMD